MSLINISVKPPYLFPFWKQSVGMDLKDYKLVFFLNVKCPDFNFGNSILFSYLLAIVVNCWHGFYWYLTWGVRVWSNSSWHCSAMKKLWLFRTVCIQIDVHCVKFSLNFSKTKQFKSMYHNFWMKKKYIVNLFIDIRTWMGNLPSRNVVKASKVGCKNFLT